MTAPADRPDTGMDGVVARLEKMVEWFASSSLDAAPLSSSLAAADLRALIASHQERGRALEVIAAASERSETMFGGKMSDVTRVFQNISRVARSALTHTKE